MRRIKGKGRNLAALFFALLLLLTLVLPLTTSLSTESSLAAEPGDADPFLTIKGGDFGGQPVSSPSVREKAKSAYCTGYVFQTQLTSELLSRAVYGVPSNPGIFDSALQEIRDVVGRDNWTPEDLVNPNNLLILMTNAPDLMRLSYRVLGRQDVENNNYGSKDAVRRVGYMLRLKKDGTQVPIIGIYGASQPPSSPAQETDCGNPYPGRQNANASNAYRIMVPFDGVGGALSNPNKWQGVLAWNVRMEG